MTMAIYIPVTLYEFVKHIYHKPNKFIDFLGYIIWGNFLAQLILQFIFGISLLNMLPILYAVYAICATLGIGLIIHHLFTYKNDKNNINFALVTILIICIGAVAEIIVLCVAPERTDLIGVSSIVVMLVYLIVNHFHILYNESKIDMKRLALERNYHKLQNTTLMQQIKAHFFFNTLNTISALCKYDPKGADDAILVFAQYMRSYMKLINEHENIPFEEELEIVNASLQIEKLRFPDSFTYEIQAEFTDFEIPPLSIQPIIENSMIHGLRTLGKNGKITLHTQKVGEFIHITIQDNGVGFDTDILENTESIGLKNLKQRVKIMADGEIKIKSQANHGTQTVFILPITQNTKQ